PVCCSNRGTRTSSRPLSCVLVVVARMTSRPFLPAVVVEAAWGEQPVRMASSRRSRWGLARIPLFLPDGQIRLTHPRNMPFSMRMHRQAVVRMLRRVMIALARGLQRVDVNGDQRQVAQMVVELVGHLGSDAVA